MNVLHVALALAFTASTFLALSSPAQADGSWIDGPLQSWNVPGQGVPAAPMVSPDTLDPRCLDSTRPAETIEDSQIESQGWRLVGTYQSGWNLRVVTATSSFDGMCRPLGFQTFAFHHGAYAGTVSPSPMDSRTDGAAGNVRILPHSRSGAEPLQMNATFARYKAADALCCPSATSTVLYQIDFVNEQPVLTPISAQTTATSSN